jgi:hypothetical protein
VRIFLFLEPKLPPREVSPAAPIPPDSVFGDDEDYETLDMGSDHHGHEEDEQHHGQNQNSTPSRRQSNGFNYISSRSPSPSPNITDPAVVAQVDAVVSHISEKHNAEVRDLRRLIQSMSGQLESMAGVIQANKQSHFSPSSSMTPMPMSTPTPTNAYLPVSQHGHGYGSATYYPGAQPSANITPTFNHHANNNNSTYYGSRQEKYNNSNNKGGSGSSGLRNSHNIFEYDHTQNDHHQKEDSIYGLSSPTGTMDMGMADQKREQEEAQRIDAFLQRDRARTAIPAPQPPNLLGSTPIKSSQHHQSHSQSQTKSRFPASDDLFVNDNDFNFGNTNDDDHDHELYERSSSSKKSRDHVVVAKQAMAMTTQPKQRTTYHASSSSRPVKFEEMQKGAAAGDDDDQAEVFFPEDKGDDADFEDSDLDAEHDSF